MCLIADAVNYVGGEIVFHESIHKTLNLSPEQMTICPSSSVAIKTLSRQNLKFLISVRNPYTRVLSLYLHISKGGLCEIPFNWQKKLGLNKSFVTFKEFLIALHKRGASNIDGHTFPISEFSFWKFAKYDYVVYFEDYFNDAFNIFSKYLENPDLKRSGVKTNANDKIFDFYDSESIDIVKKSTPKIFYT